MDTAGVDEPRLPLRARYALFFALDEPRFPLRVRYALFIALSLVGVGIAFVIDVGHIIALVPSVALGLMNILDWLYRRRTRRQRLHTPPLR